jgi:hypothetical protein
MPVAQYFQSIDDAPLCASCAHSPVTWPRRFDDVRWHDRCGAGVLTGGRSADKCFSYEGDRAKLVTLEPTRQTDDRGWQDRTDGRRLRKPK